MEQLRSVAIASLGASLALLFGLACPGGSLRAAAPEPHAAQVLAQLSQLRERVLAEDQVASDKAVFIALWDFDGTLLKGDCSEGYSEQGKVIYEGLAQRCIEAGFSPDYHGQGAFTHFWADYTYMDEHVGHWLAYPFLAQVLAGAKEREVQAFARDHFSKVMGAYYFSASVTVLRGLEKLGVENHVISASPEPFVRAAAETLGLPEERFHGIRVRVDDRGCLTRELLQPATLCEGKRACLLQLVQETLERHPGCRVYMLAAFGNSFSSDGPFLDYTASQRLGAQGHGLAVMINGGPAPECYRGHFLEVSQDAVTGP